MDLNLDTLKQEILGYLENAGFAVFHSHPGGLEGMPMVTWDAERYPDYQIFLETARKIGCKMVLFASRDFDRTEIEEALEQLEETDISAEERRDLERRLRSMRGYEGVTCSLELAFDHNARMYVYELRPDWYEEFLGVCDEITSHLPVEEDEDDGSMGPLYSDN
ncbi:MAG TPA: hypothetical protein VLX58_18180 [Bryobacteraceae bacterium]|nr:hypothetical protein [Bryobacteraceae bacterium]